MTPVNADEIRKRFLEFFAGQGHKIVPSSSLIPDDPSVLLTTAGMQQFKSYYTGGADPIKDFGGFNTASVQKCFRTSDIDEVGDESHLTFFEMLGNFSFGYKPGEPRSPKGGYFKKEAIQYGYDFFRELGLPIDYVTVFGGDFLTSLGQALPADEESEKIWRGLGVSDIRRNGRADNFWGPTGGEGPCGPTTEIYVNGVEISNIVFNQYYCASDKTLSPLEKPGVDTGMGLERLAMVLQKKKNIFETDLFNSAMRELSGALSVRTRRILADHIRAVAFLISDGLRPSNKEAGYVLRRLIRRIISFAYEEGIGKSPEYLLNLVADEYKAFPDYRNLDPTVITRVYREECEIFLKTLARGRKEFEKEAKKIKDKNIFIIPRTFAFNLYQSAGITIDALEDFAKKEGVEIDKKAFTEDLEGHKEISRAGLERKFGGHGLMFDTGELKAADEAELRKVTRLHTATHLLNAALRKILGESVEQRGSDITIERARFDFLFHRKLTPGEVKKIEDLVNYAIAKNFPVKSEEMPLDEARRSGALAFYKGRYPERVKVYTAGDEGEIFSRELCGGPHAGRTGEIGRFKIIKEEASSAGVRRIRAVIDP